MLRAALDEGLEVIADEWGFSQNSKYTDLREVGWGREGVAFNPVNAERFWPPIAPEAQTITTPW